MGHRKESGEQNETGIERGRLSASMVRFPIAGIKVQDSGIKRERGKRGNDGSGGSGGERERRVVDATQH